MPDRGINTPCDRCLDEDGRPKRGWTAKELEAVRRSHSQRSTLVAISAGRRCAQRLRRQARISRSNAAIAVSKVATAAIIVA
jgi:hypothetical protein